MKKLNKKGFTLVELIATVVILGLVVAIGSYSIIGLINSSKRRDYELLVKEINNSVESYYLECKYSSGDVVICPTGTVNGGVTYYEIKLDDLVKYGYLKGNSGLTDEDNEGKLTLVNPNDGNFIADCIVKYAYNNGKLTFYDVNNTNTSCPDMTE